jgi:hypothetical protein
MRYKFKSQLSNVTYPIHNRPYDKNFRTQYETYVFARKHGTSTYASHKKEITFQENRISYIKVPSVLVDSLLNYIKYEFLHEV